MTGLLTSGMQQTTTVDREAEDAPLCPACEYNLRGLTSSRCPECGRDVTAVLQGRPALPWLERERIGLLTAYWRAVWLVTFRPRRLSRMIANPGSERDARRFRAMTLAHVAAAVLVLDLTVFLFFGTVWKEIVYAIAPWYVAGWHVSFGIGLIALTSAPWYAIDSRRIPPEQSLPAAILGFYTSVAGHQRPEIHDHVDLTGAALHGPPGFARLRRGQRRAQRKPGHAADGRPRAGQPLRAALNPDRIHARRRKAKLAALIAQAINLRGGRLGLEERVVDAAGEFWNSQCE